MVVLCASDVAGGVGDRRAGGDTDARGAGDTERDRATAGDTDRDRLARYMTSNETNNNCARTVEVLLISTTAGLSSSASSASNGLLQTNIKMQSSVLTYTRFFNCPVISNTALFGSRGRTTSQTYSCVSSRSTNSST
jgi:hypothetical protein